MIRCLTHNQKLRINFIASSAITVTYMSNNRLILSFIKERGREGGREREREREKERVRERERVSI